MGRIGWIVVSAALAAGAGVAVAQTSPPSDHVSNAVTAEVLALDDESAAPLEIGPPVGSPVSSAVFGPDHEGRITDFSDLTGPRGLVLVFVRSVDWCPICQIETIKTDQRRAEFATREVGLAFVTHDAPEAAYDFVEDRLSPEARLIAAGEVQLIERLAMTDPSFPTTNRYYGAPFPTALVVDHEGVVHAKVYLEAPPADAYGSGQALVTAGYDWDAQIDEILALVDAAFWAPDEAAGADAPTP